MKETHSDLVKRAEKWLRGRFRCRVVLTEFIANTSWFEIPDAIGWVNNRTILIECKTSRSDFTADLKKPFRHPIAEKTVGSLGDWRFYLTPPGLLKSEEVPDGWGLYEVQGRRIRFIGGNEYNNAAFPPFKSNWNSEKALLISALAKSQREKQTGRRCEDGNTIP